MRPCPAERLAHCQRQTSRCRAPKGKPQTKGYRKAQRQAAKLHKKVTRQRQDTGRNGVSPARTKLRAWGRAKAVVRDHDALAVEDFRPRFLAKSTMARKAADAAIGATETALIEMARKHGRTLHLVHPAHTTMDCAHCGARAKHRLPLSERTYTCTACGTSSPRDKNSARVMLVRAGLNPASADLVSPAPCWGTGEVSRESPSFTRGRSQSRAFRSTAASASTRFVVTESTPFLISLRMVRFVSAVQAETSSPSRWIRSVSSRLTRPKR